MNHISAFSSPFFVGCNEIERVLEKVSNNKNYNNDYPSYNIEKLSKNQNQYNTNYKDVIRITLSVAGFRQQDLNLYLENNKLIIKGEKYNNDQKHEYFHQGIYIRSFQKAFELSNGIKILKADLKQGLLSIDLARHEPKHIIKKIDISVSE